MRVGPTPAIAVHGVVQGLCAVADIMAEADDVEGAMLFCKTAVAAGGLGCTDIAHADDDPLIGLDRRIGQRTGPADVGARCGSGVRALDLFVLFEQRDHEFVP